MKVRTYNLARVVMVMALGSPACALGVQGTVGPVVTEVEPRPDGVLSVKRCEIVNGVSLRNCKRNLLRPGDKLPPWEE